MQKKDKNAFSCSLTIGGSEVDGDGEVELASSLDVVKEGELRLYLGCCQENEARILVVFLLFLFLGVDDLQKKFEESIPFIHGLYAMFTICQKRMGECIA